jgi:hypothetical protein
VFSVGHNATERYTAGMKRCLAILIGLSAAVAFADPPSRIGPTNDAAVISVVVPGVKRIVPTSYGFRVESASGSRTAYRTSTGYYVEGGGGSPALDIRRTSTGFTVQDAGARGDAIRQAQGR